MSLSKLLGFACGLGFLVGGFALVDFRFRHGYDLLCEGAKAVCFGGLFHVGLVGIVMQSMGGNLSIHHHSTKLGCAPSPAIDVIVRNSPKNEKCDFSATASLKNLSESDAAFCRCQDTDYVPFLTRSQSDGTRIGNIWREIEWLSNGPIRTVSFEIFPFEGAGYVICRSLTQILNEDGKAGVRQIAKFGCLETLTEWIDRRNVGTQSPFGGISSMVNRFPHYPPLLVVNTALGCADYNEEESQQIYPPIGRRMILTITCAVLGVPIMAMMAVEKISEKHRVVREYIDWAGWALFIFGLAMWWLTFAYPPSWNWIL